MQVSPVIGSQGVKKLDRAGVGRWLLEQAEGHGSSEEKLERIRAFAWGLVAE